MYRPWIKFTLIRWTQECRDIRLRTSSSFWCQITFPLNGRYEAEISGFIYIKLLLYYEVAHGSCLYRATGTLTGIVTLVFSCKPGTSKVIIQWKSLWDLTLNVVKEGNWKVWQYFWIFNSFMIFLLFVGLWKDWYLSLVWFLVCRVILDSEYFLMMRIHSFARAGLVFYIYPIL